MYIKLWFKEIEIIFNPFYFFTGLRKCEFNLVKDHSFAIFHFRKAYAFMKL